MAVDGSGAVAVDHPKWRAGMMVYIVFCLSVFIFVSWQYHKNVNNLTYGTLILVYLASIFPILNVGMFLLFLWGAFKDILDKEVFNET